MRVMDIEMVCTKAFQVWCAEELVDPRLFDILEEAFMAGFLARENLRIEVEGEEVPVP